MAMLFMVGLVAVSAALYFLLHWFNQRCYARFHYHFFTRTSFFISGASLFCVFAGYKWHQDALVSQGDPLNGIVLAMLGGLIAVGLVVYNFRHTDRIYGFWGSILQLGVFGVLAAASIVAVLAVFFIAIMALAGDPNSRTTYRRRFWW